MDDLSILAYALPFALYPFTSGSDLELTSLIPGIFLFQFSETFLRNMDWSLTHDVAEDVHKYCPCCLHLSRAGITAISS